MKLTLIGAAAHRPVRLAAAVVAPRDRIQLIRVGEYGGARRVRVEHVADVPVLFFAPLAVVRVPAIGSRPGCFRARRIRVVARQRGRGTS